MELGRLGLAINDIERTDRPPNRKTVLSDLIEWLTQHPGEAFARLVDWQKLDFAQLRARLAEDHSARPRIELSAHITKMNNLSVLWHPEGWRNAQLNRTERDHFNLITHRRWLQPPDFDWFVGDETPSFDTRPSNELMFLRGVGSLKPEPRDYGPHAKYNNDVVDSILICAVRSAYECLIEQLKYSFEVNVLDSFDFVTKEEIDENDSSPYRFPRHRVIAWSLEDAAELRARREHNKAAQQDERDRAVLANITPTYGFTIETFVVALQEGYLKKSSGPAPSGNYANQKAAKNLRNAGFTINADEVRRIRQLLERYTPEVLPENLRPLPPSPSKPDNILPFPEG